MSEVQARPSAPRGRSSGRGGRGGFGSRGGVRNPPRQANGDLKDTPVDSLEDQGEIGQMKKKYSSQLSTLKELFPDWSDMDLVLALQESDGDLQATIDKISEGNVAQFADVKKKDRARSKAKELATDTAGSVPRGGRGRGGFDGSRGGRGRGAERAARGGRGSRAAPATVNHPAAVASVPITESPARDSAPTATEDTNNSWESPNNSWETPAENAPPDNVPDGQWESVPHTKTTPAAAPEIQKSSLIPEGGPPKSWASIFAKPKPAPAQPKAAPIHVPAQQPEPELEPAALQTSSSHDIPPETSEAEALPPPAPTTEYVPSNELLATDGDLAEGSDIMPSDSASVLTPSKDELTEDNVEHLPDTSGPDATETAASTVGSSGDMRSLMGSATPLPASQQPPIARPPMGGYATTAYKATGMPGRSASFQRRILEQQEAVVMPGHNAVDRATVQFGSMGLNGDPENLDVEDDREEAETRAQPPQSSPPQPRASLPPVPRSSTDMPNDPSLQDSLKTPREVPGLPPAPQQAPQMASQPPASQLPLASQAMAQQGSQGSHQYGQFGRYGQPVMQEYGAPTQKPYDAFGQQVSQASSQQIPYEGFGGHSQAPTQPQQPAQTNLGSFTSAQNDYSSYYTSDQQRNAYQNYYGSSYAQQGGATNQDGPSQARTDGAFAGSGAESSTYPATQPQQVPSRFSENQLSGHNTPNPIAAGQQTSAHQQPHAQSGHGGYPYTHPYYNNHHAAYMNQYGYGQQGYGGPFGGNKASIYAQPHHGYGMNPQASHEYSSSPANAGGFGGREASLGSSFGDYGRSGSAQLPQAHQQHSTATAAFGSMPDVFARSHGYQGQSQYGQQAGSQQAEESLKPFGEPKAGSGPSPSLGGQPGRPGSAANSAVAQSGQTGLSHQQGFGGAYPAHYQNTHGSQYGGGLGGLGAQHGAAAGGYHQAGTYGNYGAGFSGQYANYGRGGWGGSYGH